MSDALKKAAHWRYLGVKEPTMREIPPEPKDYHAQQIKKAAALLGKRGGESRSEAKVKASRENGKKNTGKKGQGK